MSRRKARLATCPDCRGATESVGVVGRNRYGEPMPGIQVRGVDCSTCGSTGKVKRARQAACCCSSTVPAWYGGAKCEGCAGARRGGAEVHVCRVENEDEAAFTAELLLMPSTTAEQHVQAAGRRRLEFR